MREVNFSIPNVNKASVGITTALYDRRALDCTSTLPLINSLNHLAYLTTSSARIRDILTVDGGVERLVVILKEGRSKDLMSMWKWNLAFQCVVNIGVRGSEKVRTRVVEADMVPVIATILDNYIQVTDKVRAKNEAANANAKRSASSGCQVLGSRGNRHNDRGIRRPSAPHNIEIPPPLPNTQLERNHADFLASNVQRSHGTHMQGERGAFGRYQQPHGRQQDGRSHQHYPSNTGPILRGENGGIQLMAPLPTMDITLGFGGLQPVRDADRLPSMMLQVGGPSQPVSPTTPNAPLTGPPYNSRIAHRNGRLSIRHQRSMSGDSDGADADEIAGPAVGMEGGNEPIVDIQTGVDMERDAILESVDAPMALAGDGTDPQEAETFNITHRSRIDGSIINPGGNANPAMGFSPNPPAAANPGLSIPGSFQVSSRYIMDSSQPCVLLPSMPREEDVLMSLQLLAYVSKYCDLRSYFQKSHLVPTLSIKKELHLLDGEQVPQLQEPEEEVEEYLLPDDYNIFPLVEKFTVLHHPADMQYWAGVVMRNLCRKDESRGGIRQCAYYECSKWEQYTRQFAKCRRCRRTKYCSKECQKRAWVYHRHWCVAAAQS